MVPVGDNVDAVRRAWAALERHEMPGPDSFAPDAVVVGSMFPEFTDADDDLGARWSKLNAPGTPWALRLLSADETDDGRVVVLARASRHTPDGHGWDQLVAGIYELRDGLIVRAEAVPDPYELYERVGVPFPFREAAS